jgi:hypothetical protein
MDPQLALVALIVAAAGLYLARQTWRSLRGKKAGCRGGCGCAATKITNKGETSLISVEQLTQRLRAPQ